MPTDEHETFRRQLCRFLSDELKPEVRRRHRDPEEFGGWSPDYMKRFRRRLGKMGYIGISWPAEYGGAGRDMVFQLILVEELEYHRAPGLDRTITYLPQAILAFGDEAQKRYFLPRLRRGEMSLCTMYSEAEAGSDLANLSVRAELEGDEFVITGQKEYCSQAHIADYAFAAVRTGPAGGRHDGISVLLVDMASPGITVSRHRTIAGWYHHSVYLDQVRVPRPNLLGGLDQGWKTLMGAIDYERIALAAPGEVEHQLDSLVAYALEPDRLGRRPADDGAVADALVTLAVEQEAARLYAYEIAQRQSRGERPQHESSLSVLLKREAARLADVTGIQLLGELAPLRAGSPDALLEGAVEHAYRDHVYYQFAAGGFDITRNVIATRGLGLPR